jgi:hypothetical protein
VPQQFAALFDHLVGAGEKGGRNFKADRAGGRQPWLSVPRNNNSYRDAHHKWDPRSVAGQNATREQLIEATRAYLAERFSEGQLLQERALLVGNECSTAPICKPCVRWCTSAQAFRVTRFGTPLQGHGAHGTDEQIFGGK